jgi:predicted Rdx family selenoprotein
MADDRERRRDEVAWAAIRRGGYPTDTGLAKRLRDVLGPAVDE